jgi:hypothetical protein
MIREICGHYLLDNVRNKIQAVLGRLNKVVHGFVHMGMKLSSFASHDQWISYQQPGLSAYCGVCHLVLRAGSLQRRGDVLPLVPTTIT